MVHGWVFCRALIGSRIYMLRSGVSCGVNSTFDLTQVQYLTRGITRFQNMIRNESGISILFSHSFLIVSRYSDFTILCTSICTTRSKHAHPNQNHEIMRGEPVRDGWPERRAVAVHDSFAPHHRSVPVSTASNCLQNTFHSKSEKNTPPSSDHAPVLRPSPFALLFHLVSQTWRAGARASSS